MPISKVLFSFHGRIGRQTWWISIISINVAVWVLGKILQGIATNRQSATIALLLLLLISVFVLWMALAIQVKRWHDRNKSGWWVLINLIPIIGLLWTIIELGFLAVCRSNRIMDNLRVVNRWFSIVSTGLW